MRIVCNSIAPSKLPVGKTTTTPSHKDLKNYVLNSDANHPKCRVKSMKLQVRPNYPQ